MDQTNRSTLVKGIGKELAGPGEHRGVRSHASDQEDLLGDLHPTVVNLVCRVYLAIFEAHK